MGGIDFRCEVRDTGIGIPEDKQGILFNVFSQMDASTTREYGGSGLGLAISKKLVEAMGGEIGVESRPGVGSLFWFEVPLEQGSITAPPATERRVVAASPPRRVLLVEDVELNRVLIAEMLRAHGHEVATAENGQEAVTAVARDPFDLVLMDVQMPVMDGVEATRQIRRLPPPAGAVPILALSANVMPEDRARYLAAGMNGALTKPIDWPELFEALAEYGIPPTPGSPGDPPLDEAVFERLQRIKGAASFPPSWSRFLCAIPQNVWKSYGTRWGVRMRLPSPISPMRSKAAPPISGRKPWSRSAPPSRLMPQLLILAQVRRASTRCNASSHAPARLSRRN